MDPKVQNILSSAKERTKTSQGSGPAVTDGEVALIGKELARISSPLTNSPRVYTLLYLIDGLHTVNDFLAGGVTDASLPLSSESVPARLDGAWIKRVLDYQKLVLALGLLVESGELVSAPFEDLGFDVKTALGRDDSIVESTYTGRKYLMLKDGFMKPDKRKAWDEVRLIRQHHHLFTRIGAFQNLDGILGWGAVGLVLSPPADTHLDDFLRANLGAASNPRSAERAMIKSFFGCITSGLEFLQSEMQRLENDWPLDLCTHEIMVHDGQILLRPTVFTNNSTPKNYGPYRNEAESLIRGILSGGGRGESQPGPGEPPSSQETGVLSLAVVFQEILGVLALKIAPSPSPSSSFNPTYARELRASHLKIIIDLQSLKMTEWTEPLEWTRWILATDPAPTATDVLNRINKSTLGRKEFIGTCCASTKELIKAPAATTATSSASAKPPAQPKPSDGWRDTVFARWKRSSS